MEDYDKEAAARYEKELRELSEAIGTGKPILHRYTATRLKAIAEFLATIKQ